jgi:hypothetical protein
MRTAAANGAHGGDQLDLGSALKSGQLLAYGITAGVAAAVNAPAWTTNGSKIEGAASAAEPYVALVPAYWFMSDSDTRHQCAAVTTASLQAQAAQTQAGVRAQGTTISSDAALRAVTSPDTQPAAQAAIDYHNSKSNCTLRWLGIFGGVSTSFQVNTDISGSDSSRSVRPIVSFGLVIIPHPWVHILVGLTLSNVQSSTTGSSTGDVQMWSSVFGIGGPLDIASAFIGSAGTSGGKSKGD